MQATLNCVHLMISHMSKSLRRRGALVLAAMALSACSGIAHSPETAAIAAPMSEFPEIANWDSLRMTLTRGGVGCQVISLSCPAYRVEIRGDGRVTFQLLIPEQPSRERTAWIPKSDVREVYRQFRRFRFSMWKELPVSVSCGPTVTTLAFDGFRKTVQDCSNVMAYLDEVIDRAARVDRWITVRKSVPDGYPDGYVMATSGLVPSLVREADISLLRDVLEDG